MNHQRSQLQAVDKAHSRLPAACQREGDDAAASVRQILLCQLMIWILCQRRVVDRFHLAVLLQKASDLIGILTVALHPQVQRFQPMIEQKGSLRRRVTAQVAHQLHARLGDIGSPTKIAGVHHAVIRLVRLGKFGEVSIGPVKIAAVHNDTAQLGGVTVHIFGGGMDHDVRSILKRTAEDRSGKGVVNNQRDTARMSDPCHLFDVQHCDGRIGNRFGKNRFGIRLNLAAQCLLVGIGIHKGNLDTKTLEGHGKQIDGAAVDGGSTQDVVAGTQDVQNTNQGGCLSRGGAQRTHAALQRSNLFLHCRYGRVGNAGIHMSIVGQVKQLCDLRGGLIFIGSALINRQSQRLSVGGCIALMQALCFDFHVDHSF